MIGAGVRIKLGVILRPQTIVGLWSGIHNVQLNYCLFKPGIIAFGS